MIRWWGQWGALDTPPAATRELYLQGFVYKFIYKISITNKPNIWNPYSSPSISFPDGDKVVSSRVRLETRSAGALSDTLRTVSGVGVLDAL